MKYVGCGGGYCIDQILEGEEKEYAFSQNQGKFNTMELITTANPLPAIEVILVDSATGQSVNDVHLSESSATIFEMSDGLRLLEIDNLNGEMSCTVRIINKASDGIMTVCVINDKEKNCLNAILLNDTQFSKVIVAGVLLLFVVSLVVVNYLIRKDKWNIYSFFIVAGVSLGLAYLILITPWSAPDSPAHFSAAYRFSNILLGFQQDGDYWVARQGDIDFIRNKWKSVNPSLSEYIALTDYFGWRNTVAGIVKMPIDAEYMVYYSAVNYIPQIIGLSIGRVFDLGIVPCVTLARIFTLTFYIVGCYHALSVMPVGKSAFAMIPLLPMCLMMSGSFSYDATLIVITSNFVACVFSLQKEDKARTRFFETIIWAFLLGAVKGGAGAVLIPVAFIICHRRGKKKSFGRVAVIALAGLFSLLLFDFIIPGDDTFFQFGEEGSGRLTAAYALNYPMKYLRMAVNTYLQEGWTIIGSMIGSHLCWWEHTIVNGAIVAYLVILFLGAIFEKDASLCSGKIRFTCLMVVFTALLITPVMLLSWTHEGADYVEGIQGRYFLPVFPLLIIALVKGARTKHIKDSIESKYYLLAAIGNNYKIWFFLLSWESVYALQALYLTR